MNRHEVERVIAHALLFAGAISAWIAVIIAGFMWLGAK